MIKLPARPDGQWTITHNNDKLPDISANRNLTFDKEGYLRLSKPLASFYSEVDDADFGVPIFYAPAAAVGEYNVLTEEKQFNLNMYNSGGYGTMTCAETVATNAPDNTTSNLSSATVFNQLLTYANPADRKLYTVPDASALDTAWTVRDVSALLEAGSSLNICTLESARTIAVANDAQVDTITNAYAADEQLIIADDYTITGIVFNNNYLGITTHAKNNYSRAMFYVWDGLASSANYVTEIPSTSSYSPVAYKGSFAFLDGNGVMWYWTPQGLQKLAELPVFFTNATLATGVYDNNKNNSVISDGEIIYINIKSQFTTSNENDEIYQSEQIGGIWCYDPAVGLYHRHAPTGTKIVTETIATTAVNTTTDVLTVTTGYESGTPVRYSDGGSTAITGLVSGQLYYTIYVSGTTIKLASSYDNAIAGTAIDLTGTGNNAQTLQHYLKTDFGQSYLTGQQGVVYLENRKTVDADLYYSNIFYGSECAIDTTTEYDVGGFMLKDTENRGYFITSKIMSRGIKDTWQKLYLKHKLLSGELDSIVVKYRTDDNEPLTRIKKTTDGVITWTDSDTFTTTDTQWANVAADDEVEIIQGTGSGYLVHVSSISEAGGTYTVNIDESIKNLTAAKTGRAVASRWKKLNVIDSDFVTYSDGYSEIAVGVSSKSIQFKIELRGENVEIEELLIANELNNPA